MGALAGFVGISCCVTPTVLALLGLSSVSFAISLGNTLYGAYGWYFRLAGLAVAVAGIALLLRATRSCSVRGVWRQWRLLVSVTIAMAAVYVALYWLTAWLARLSSPA